MFYYDDLLRGLIKLAIMETGNEDKDCCALFVRGINGMGENFVNKRVVQVVQLTALTL